MTFAILQLDLSLHLVLLNVTKDDRKMIIRHNGREMASKRGQTKYRQKIAHLTASRA